MALSTANRQKSWSNLGHVTIVTISGPKVRAQNGRVCCKWAKKLVNFWSCHECDSFRHMTFRHEQTPDKKTRADPELDQVKMALSTANGLKSRCILVDRSLAKQPPRGPFAHELRNQTGGNKYIFRILRHFCSTNQKI